MCLLLWCSFLRWWNDDGKPTLLTWLLIYSSFGWWLVLAYQQLHFLLIYTGIYTFGLFFLLRYTSASHWDSDVIFCVDVTAPSTRRCATEDDCRHVHGGAAEVKILLTKDPHEAAFAQTVGFRNVFRISCGIIWNSVRKQIIKIH